MQRLVVLIAFGSIVGALFAMACGGGNEKPPLTPDSDHASPTMGEDASSGAGDDTTADAGG